MGTLTRLGRRVPALVKAGAVVGLMWGTFAWGLDAVLRALLRLNAYLERASLPGWDRASARVMVDVLEDAFRTWASSLGLLFLAFTLAIPLGMLARTVARARARAGARDPLDAARRWTTEYPTATKALLAGPALLWLSRVASELAMYIGDKGGHDLFGHAALYVLGMGIFGCVSAVAALGIHAGTRVGVRAMLAPTIDPDAKAAKAPDHQVEFAAVAVTPETRAAVFAMAMLPILTLLATQAAHLGSAGTEAALAAYSVLAILAALAFRRASRIAVGVDGVFVTGTSRTRFGPVS